MARFVEDISPLATNTVLHCHERIAQQCMRRLTRVVRAVISAKSACLKDMIGSKVFPKEAVILRNAQGVMYAD